LRNKQNVTAAAVVEAVMAVVEVAVAAAV